MNKNTLYDDGDKTIRIGSLQPGHRYGVPLDYFEPPVEAPLDYLDERIVQALLKKIQTGSLPPEIIFTVQEDGEFKIVSGLPNAKAAYLAGFHHIEGCYISHSQARLKESVRVL